MVPTQARGGMHQSGAGQLHCIMLDPTGEPQAFALGSRGLGEVDSDFYLVPTS